MTYTGFLVSNYSTGFDRTRQPWLLPDDAQDVLFDGFVYRGVWQKREGYSQFATGQRGGAAYCESRIVHEIEDEILGTGDGVTLVFDFVLAETPVRRGTFTISYTIAASVETATDNGLGFISGTDVNASLSTINYTTGAVHMVFTIAPDNATDITATYDYHPGNPVMGIMTFYRADRERELIVQDTRYVNKYNALTNRLEDISTTTYTGTNKNFWSWANYNNADDDERLLFVNNADPIQQYDGTTVSEYPVYTASTSVTGASYGTGDGTTGPYNFSTPANTAIAPANVVITDTVGAQTITFNQLGDIVTGSAGTGSIDFLAGTVSVTFSVAVGIGDPITIDYTQLNTPIDTTLHLFQYKDRLVLLRPTISTKSFNKRIMISGTGIYSDVFAPNVAIGAGFIDIPTDGYIVSASFNRDDLLICTNIETWIMKYTGNDVVPFSIDKIDSSRGSDAPFGMITYLNRSDFGSTRGFCVSDGYTVDRRDDKIPDYSYDEINQDNFDLCFAGNVDIDRDHYLIHPSKQATTSDRILVYNYEELNYAIYRIPLSCMGTFIGPFTVTWNDLLVFDNWDQMAAEYGNWFNFAYTESSPISLGGGHEGQIFYLNKSESEDYGVKIRNITVTNNVTIQVTTDFQNYNDGDVVSLEGVQGMFRASDIQGPITVVDSYNFQITVGDTANFSNYTLNTGMAYKVIKFESATKKFNPFADSDKKIKCGWMYMYVSSQDDTNLTEKKDIQFVDLTNPCEVTIPGHNYQTGQQITIQEIVGTTQLNGEQFYVTVLDSNLVTLDGVDATAYTPYVSGGFSATKKPGKLQILVVRDDDANASKVSLIDPLVNVGRLTNLVTETGSKRWYKIWINQVGRFIQFIFTNQQAGANVQIQAYMPGFTPTGRMI